MTTITIERSLLERLYLYWLEDADPHELDEFTAQVRAALSAPATAPVTAPVTAPEPVAWRAWFDKDSGARWLFSLWPDEENKGLEVDWQPLYTAPQPERKPMTDMEIQEAWNDHYLEHDMNEFDYYRMGQSDAERHHGIKP